MAGINDQSDIAALWDDALNGYTETSKINIRSVLSSQNSVATILMQQQNELDTFTQFRHNKGKLDKLRSLIASNSDYIQSAANQIASAASTAFPPSSAILTAFTYILTASKHVSDDYNIIESFFDVMQCFLRRLSLLEGKIPPRKEFHQDLIKVFSSILAISGLAYSYCLKGRFRLWASALVEGKDPKLKAAYDKLHENLRRLESATMLQTLRTAIDIHDDTKTIKEGMRTMQASLDRNTTLTEQTLAAATGTSSSVTELMHHSFESAHVHQEILRIVRKQAHDAAGQQHQLKSRASRPANFARLRQLLDTAAVEAAMHDRLQELERETLPSVFDWVRADPALGDVAGWADSGCWVSGASGMGKSTMAFKLFRHLSDMFAHEEETRVACFFFDADTWGMRSANNMCRWCAVQVAETDARYCEALLRDLRDEPHQSTPETQDIEKEWHRMIESKYTVESSRRLILVLDGIDEVEDGHLAKLLDIIGRTKDKRSHKIQFIVTCDVERRDALASVMTRSIELNKDKIAGDLQLFAQSQVKTLTRLAKLRPGFRRLLVRKVIASADCENLRTQIKACRLTTFLAFVYIAHTMQRLNGIGHEAPIRKELGKLPSTTTALYELLLNDCQKNRSPEDRVVLRHLLSWLAYAKSELSTGEAELLINIIEKENSVSIDEAFDGPLGWLLRISSSGNRDDGGSDHGQSELDTQESGDSDDEASITEEATNFVNFQRRSLRAFFRQAIDDPRGLRCSSTEAQVIIFKIISTILVLESEYSTSTLLYHPEKCASGLLRQAGLKQYAATWAFAHFLEIDMSKTSNEMAGVVLESLFNILNNKNGCLKFMELVSWRLAILQGKDADEDQVLATITSWAKRAPFVPQGSLSVHAQETFRSIASEPRRVYVVLARAQVTNWFSADNVGTALAAFQCAHNSLLKIKELPELQGISLVKDDLPRCATANPKFAVECLLSVFNAFDDIQKTSNSYLGIAMVMFGWELYEDAVKQCDIGLRMDAAMGDSDRLSLLQCKGETLCRAGDFGEDEKRRQYFREALETLGLAIEVYFKLERENALTENDSKTMAFSFYAHAHAATVLGEFDLVLRSMKHAASSAFWGGDMLTLKRIVAALVEENQHRMVIEALQTLPKADLADFFLQAGTKTQTAFQEAAQRSSLGHCLLNLYNSASKELATDSTTLAQSISVPNLRIVAALFARQVLHDDDVAKSLLSETVHSPQSYYSTVEYAAYLLAEMLLEDFRHSSDPHAKAAALKATRALHIHLAEVMGAAFRPAEAPTTIVLALMLKAMGPALEHADTLRQAFAACVELLTDDIGYNDRSTLRHLARVLACVTGMEREAEVAMTAQLYVLDRGVRERELAAQRRMLQEAEAEDEGDMALAPVADQQHPGPPVVRDEMAEGLLEDAFFWCNDCDSNISDWAHGDVYMCVYCTDCDLCEECFVKKLAQEKGETAPGWRVICPEGHRHVKAPVEGWKGVCDGVLRIGDEEVPFRDWLKSLETKWEAFWDSYWATSLD